MQGSSVRDRRPPRAVLAVVNPVLRALLTSPLARLVGGSLALLEFTGRRSGRRYRVPVGWYDVDGREVVFTPAPWKENFRGGAPVTVWHRGRARPGRGSLVDDPAAVAASLQRVLDGGTAPRQLGLRVPAGRRVTADDLEALGRRMVRFDIG